jgi:glycosyltransferase involved in cell wall biosynthesis
LSRQNDVRVSIVLTAYNRAEALRGTLDSLLSQTFREFELLVCDDMSSDHTETVAREYATRDNRVVYHRNRRNLGMPGNLNEGIRRSRGHFVANLHDGDIYEPDMIEKWVSALESHPGAAFVFNKYRMLNATGETAAIYAEPLPPVFPGRRLLEEIYFRRWLFDSPVWGTVMARRSAYLEAGLFDPRFGCVADVDMWMRLAENHEVAYIGEPLIRLAAPEALPSNWVVSAGVVRAIFWESRRRHYRKRPLRMMAELGRHLAFSMASRVYLGACRVKLAIATRIRHRTPRTC